MNPTQYYYQNAEQNYNNLTLWGLICQNTCLLGLIVICITYLLALLINYIGDIIQDIIIYNHRQFLMKNPNWPPAHLDIDGEAL